MRWLGRLLGFLGLAPLMLLTMTACGAGSDCEDGSVEQRVCVECGPAGGCGRWVEQCARVCDADSDCGDGPPDGCIQGVCQVTGCY
jgi:hypothetical protein